jgi:hypothetical protein
VLVTALLSVLVVAEHYAASTREARPDSLISRS